MLCKDVFYKFILKNNLLCQFTCARVASLDYFTLAFGIILIKGCFKTIPPISLIAVPRIKDRLNWYSMLNVTMLIWLLKKKNKLKNGLELKK
jgi:hypothetical protein